MHISRIKMRNWKNFPTVDVHLSNRIFIIGANATGKSNLLDSLRFLRDIAKGQGGGLQLAMKERGGLSKVRCYAARSKPWVELEIQLNSDNSEEPKFVYQLGLSQETKGFRRPVVKYEKVTVNGNVVLTRPDNNDREDSERLTETHLEQTSANHKFREIASFFRDICYLHLVPQMVRNPETATGNSLNDDPFGKSFLERVANTPEKTRKNRLKKIENALKIITPQLTQLTFKYDKKGQPHLEARYEHWRPEAGQQSEIQFSDGTLRAIGLLWMLQEKSTLLLIEEPELSLNSEITKQLPAMFSMVSRKNKRQLIVSTHSHDLLSDKGIAPEETVLLRPEKEGTSAMVLSNDESSLLLYKDGFSIADTGLPLAAPPEAEQLSLSF